jgi:hypothetical protein
MNTPVARTQVTAFVAAVRLQLDDLAPDEVDELTDGLEADLNDALSDAGTPPAEQFGDPIAYAAELRSAAGLPPRAVPGGGRPGAVYRWRERAEGLVATVRNQPWWPAVRDFVVTLRPVWWVARAMVAGFGLGMLLGSYSLPLQLVLIVISVELGRRRIVDRAPVWRSLIAVGNAIGVFGAVVIGLATLTAGGRWDLQSAATTTVVQDVTVPPTDGIWLGGREVRNIFPYDSQGRPLTGVQLYDENGNALAVGRSAQTPLDQVDDQGNVMTVAQIPGVDVAGEQRWNTYPLRQRQDGNDENGTRVVGTPSPAALPSLTPGPLLAPSAQAAPAPGPAASPTISGSAPTITPAPTSPLTSRAG